MCTSYALGREALNEPGDTINSPKVSWSATLTETLQEVGKSVNLPPAHADRCEPAKTADGQQLDKFDGTTNEERICMIMKTSLVLRP
jgi:hypothetical protein